MKASLKWLTEYIDIDLPVTELANKLTMAGFESHIVKKAGDWDHIIVGQLVAVQPHPNADRLRLATVDLGTEQKTVVCGAPNLNVGDKVAFANVGAQLIDGKSGERVQLQPAKIRGVISNGMICSEKELGISDNHQEIMVLSTEIKLGIPLSDALGDTIFDFEITPNRPDCLSIIGLAREISALTVKNIHFPEISYVELDKPIEQLVSVEIKAADLCPRYCASLITDVRVGESPEWLQRRLYDCGMRPINNIVDVTNYVMLEHGQPLHAFDYSLIKDRKIIVRRAVDGESIVSLDSIERHLSQETLVITDTERAIAIAGIMGGVNTEVSDKTVSVLLEAASFSPANIHYSGKTLGLSSEACMRFERGIRSELALPALQRATQLIIQLTGGKAAKGVVDNYPGRKQIQPILLSTAMFRPILGIEYDRSQIIKTLESLGFICQEQSKREILVTIPYWRSDVSIPVDLIEEVARIIGYDNIPTTMLEKPLPKQYPEPIIDLKQNIRSLLVGYGFQEIITYSVISFEMIKKILLDSKYMESVLRLANPMTTDQEYLRPSLRANLLMSLVENQKHEEGGIRLFELGKVYWSRYSSLPEEPEMLCGILVGLRGEKSWQNIGGNVDFYDAKGIVEGILVKFGVVADFVKDSEPGLHPNRQAAVVVNNKKVGVIGELNPEVQSSFEISDPVYMFELNLNLLCPSIREYKLFQPIIRFPEISRDMALVVDSKVTHNEVQFIMKSFTFVKRITIFDVYTGPQVPPGKKSLAYRITFQSPDRTLTDDEVDKIQQQILDKLTNELGVELRH